MSGVRRPAKDVLRDDVVPGRSKPIKRLRNPGRKPGRSLIHMGTIACANVVLKTASVRSRLKEDFDAMAIEMESSGLAEAVLHARKGYFVVRGTCDYGNDDKNKEWQPYAATAAAAFARELVESMPLAADE